MIFDYQTAIVCSPQLSLSNCWRVSGKLCWLCLSIFHYPPEKIPLLTIVLQATRSGKKIISVGKNTHVAADSFEAEKFLNILPVDMSSSR